MNLFRRVRTIECHYCKGTGMRHDRPCPLCDGKGKHEFEKSKAEFIFNIFMTVFIILLSIACAYMVVFSVWTCFHGQLWRGLIFASFNAALVAVNGYSLRVFLR